MSTERPPDQRFGDVADRPAEVVATVVVSPGSSPRVLVDGSLVDLRPKERTIVAALVLRHPTPSPTEVLVDAVWPEIAPASARASLHNHLARLRRRIPGFVTSDRDGYRFTERVRVTPLGWDVAVVDDHDAFPDLDGAPGLVGLVRRFRRTAVSSTPPTPSPTTAPSPPSVPSTSPTSPPASAVSTPDHPVGHDPLATADRSSARRQLEREVSARPLDERNWWRLMVLDALEGRPDRARRRFDEIRRQLAQVGLEPGRRLLDLHRMVSDGVTDEERLTADAHGRRPARAAPGAQVRHDELAELRTYLAGDGAFVARLLHPPGPRRSDLLDRAVHEARLHGFDATTIRLSSSVPVIADVRDGLVHERPLLVAVDDAEVCLDPALLVDHLRSRASARSVSFVLTGPPEDGRDDGGPSAPTRGPGESVRLDLTGSGTSTAAPPTDTEALLSRLDPDTLRLARAVALLDLRLHPEELGPILDVDLVAAARAGRRLGIFRSDMADSDIDVTDGTVRDAIVASMDVDELAALAALLVDLELRGESAVVVSARRARLAPLVWGVGSLETVDAVIQAVERAAATGQVVAASTLARRAMDDIAIHCGRTLDWCRLASWAGRLEIAAGATHPTGDGVGALRDVIDVARRHGHHDLLASATLELCRLGPVATAGSADPVSADLVADLLDEIDRPADRALVGAAASMVHSFAGDPDHLRAVFDGAERDARASGDHSVLSEVLPLAFMSLPLPSDLERRRRLVEELVGLAEASGDDRAMWEALHLRLGNEFMGGDGDPRATFAQMEVHAAGLHERSRAWEMVYLRSAIALLDGDLAGARRLVDESVAFAGDVTPERVEAVFGANHLAIALAAGTDGDLAGAVAELVVAQPGVRAWRAAAAMTAAHAGDLRGASRHLEVILDAAEGGWVEDHTHTTALLCLGEAAAAVGEPAALDHATTLLRPLEGYWAWTGSCPFGPVDLTLARLHRAAGDDTGARRSAERALSAAARLRAPVHAGLAGRILLDIT